MLRADAAGDDLPDAADRLHVPGRSSTTTRRAARSPAATSTAAAACPTCAAPTSTPTSAPAFIRTFKGVSGGVAQNQQDRTADVAPGGGLSIGGVSSFGEDARGEIYIVDYGGGADGAGRGLQDRSGELNASGGDAGSPRTTAGAPARPPGSCEPETGVASATC